MRHIPRILPIDIDPIESIIPNQLDAIGSEFPPGCLVGRHGRKWLRERPAADAGVDFDSSLVSQVEEALLVVMGGADGGFAGGVPRACLLARAAPVEFAEEDNGIGPAVRSPNVTLLIDLKEGEIVARDFGHVEVGWLRVVAAVVPLPRRIIRYNCLVVRKCREDKAREEKQKQQARWRRRHVPPGGECLIPSSWRRCWIRGMVCHDMVVLVV
mmetsp:Transcript_2898/g.5700  ORF Transcript_2898/g.5700 Transcript_2898/m.5700 type:complete len:213 (-) Transcript_2898:86-724(-)